MRSFRARYAALFARADVLRFAALSLPMRMPIGTVGLGTLLHLRELTGSIAFAGSIVGAQFVAMAATSPKYVLPREWKGVTTFSMLNFTSALVNGLPSCQVTPLRSLKV